MYQPGKYTPPGEVQPSLLKKMCTQPFIDQQSKLQSDIIYSQSHIEVEANQIQNETDDVKVEATLPDISDFVVPHDVVAEEINSGDPYDEVIFKHAH